VGGGGGDTKENRTKMWPSIGLHLCDTDSHRNAVRPQVQALAITQQQHQKPHLKWGEGERERERDRETDRQIERQTERQTEREADRWRDRQRDRGGDRHRLCAVWFHCLNRNLPEQTDDSQSRDDGEVAR